jgi:hypothetical protein
MKISHLFVIAVFFLSFVGCAPLLSSQGGSYNLHEESPYHKHTISHSRDSRGQPTTVEERITKEATPGMAMGGYGSFGSYGRTPGSMGSSMYLSPPQERVHCPRGRDQSGRLVEICPSHDGVIVLVEDVNATENDPGNPYRRQTINTAAKVQEIEECLRGTRNCR